jgi:hypothetical protein
LKSKATCELVGSEDMSFELCEEFDKLNLRIVAHAKVIEIEVESTLL